MAKQVTSSKTSRTRHSDEFKSEALKLAERLGVKAAAKQLGLHESQIYGWRSKAREKMARGDLEQQQATEIARLKRQLAEQQEELQILKKASAYFAKQLK